jgi:hypothetical protein
MPSPNDNFQIRDGQANLFKMRSKDISSLQDGSLQVVRHYASQYPIDYGIGGCFQLTSKSGSMAAGLAANSPIYAFRWTSIALLAIVRRVRVSCWVLGTAFTAGIIEFDAMRVHGWTAADTGGVTDTITGDNGNMRTAMPATALSEIRHSSTATLTAGTRTVDTQPIDLMVASAVAAVTNQIVFTRQPVFDKTAASDHPLVLAQNEGFLIQATVPAIGVWAFSVTPEWDEVPLVNY